MRNAIGGKLDVAALRLLYRPTDPEALRREGLRLRRQGLHDRDLAAILGMTEAAVGELLATIPPGRQDRRCSTGLPGPGAVGDAA
jgi:hypothetical protein